MREKTIREERDAKWHRSSIAILRAGEGQILRKLKRISDQVNSIEDDFVAMTDAELRALTDEFQAAATPTASASTTCCPRRSPPCARRPSARSASGTSTCS